MAVTALLPNTRPAAGHNPAGTIPRLLGKPKSTAPPGIQDKPKQDMRKNQMPKKLGPIIPLLLRHRGKHNYSSKTRGAGIILSSVLPQNDKQFSATFLSSA
jgi:hypothetical protein